MTDMNLPILPFARAEVVSLTYLAAQFIVFSVSKMLVIRCFLPFELLTWLELLNVKLMRFSTYLINICYIIARAFI